MNNHFSRSAAFQVNVVSRNSHGSENNFDRPVNGALTAGRMLVELSQKPDPRDGEGYGGLTTNPAQEQEVRLASEQEKRLDSDQEKRHKELEKARLEGPESLMIHHAFENLRGVQEFLEDPAQVEKKIYLPTLNKSGWEIERTFRELLPTLLPPGFVTEHVIPDLRDELLHSTGEPSCEYSGSGLKLRYSLQMPKADPDSTQPPSIEPLAAWYVLEKEF